MCAVSRRCPNKASVARKRASSSAKWPRAATSAMALTIFSGAISVRGPSMSAGVMRYPRHTCGSTSAGPCELAELRGSDPLGRHGLKNELLTASRHPVEAKPPTDAPRKPSGRDRSLRLHGLAHRLGDDTADIERVRTSEVLPCAEGRRCHLNVRRAAVLQIAGGGHPRSRCVRRDRRYQKGRASGSFGSVEPNRGPKRCASRIVSAESGTPSMTDGTSVLFVSRRRDVVRRSQSSYRQSGQSRDHRAGHVRRRVLAPRSTSRTSEE